MKASTQTSEDAKRAKLKVLAECQHLRLKLDKLDHALNTQDAHELLFLLPVWSWKSPHEDLESFEDFPIKKEQCDIPMFDTCHCQHHEAKCATMEQSPASKPTPLPASCATSGASENVYFVSQLAVVFAFVILILCIDYLDGVSWHH
jgi:hypothetical protein